MTRQDRLQTFVSLSVGNWVRQCAADHGVSVSVFIRDLIVIFYFGLMIQLGEEFRLCVAL